MSRKAKGRRHRAARGRPPPEAPAARADGRASPRRWPVLLAAAAVVAAGLLAYANSFAGPFLLDDHPAIEKNPGIRRIWPITTVLRGNRPLLNLSLAVNYRLGGLEVAGYHAFNVAAHLLAGLVLLGVVRRTLLTDRLRGRFGRAAVPLALAVALIWTVHPLHTGAVTYIVQRAEVMMGLGYLLCLYCVIRGSGARRGWPWYAAGVVACAAGLGSKEVAATAPLVVLAYDRVFLSRSFRELFGRRWGLYAALAGLWLIPAWLLLTMPELSAVGFGIETSTPLEYARTQFGVIVHYLRLAFWPDELCFDSGWPTASLARRIVPQALLVAALLAATGAALWRRPAVGFLGVWFFLILAPTSSFVPLGDNAFEHRMYLPLAAVVALVVLGGYRLGGALLRRPGGPAWGPAAGGIVLVGIVAAGLVWRTRRRNEDYRDDVTIWQVTVGQAPGHARAHYGLAGALRKSERFDEAIVHYRKAVSLWPEWAKARCDLANVLCRKGRFAEAERHYLEALRLEPDFSEAHSNYGILLAQQNKLDEAVERFRLAIRYSPGNASAHYNLGMALRLQGKLEEAARHFAEARRLDPKRVPRPPPPAATTPAP